MSSMTHTPATLATHRRHRSVPGSIPATSAKAPRRATEASGHGGFPAASQVWTWAAGLAVSGYHPAGLSCL